MGKHKSKGLFGSLFTLGAGVAAGWWLRKKMRQIYENTQDFPASLQSSTVSDEQMLKQIFSKYSAQTREYYLQVQDQLKDALADLQTTVSEIDKKKYQQLVDEALMQAKQDKKVSQKSITELKNYLLGDFEKLRGSLLSEAQAVKKTVKQTAKQAANKTTKKVSSASKK